MQLYFNIASVYGEVLNWEYAYFGDIFNKKLEDTTRLYSRYSGTNDYGHIDIY
jgi:hypothetical protein